MSGSTKKSSKGAREIPYPDMLPLDKVHSLPTISPHKEIHRTHKVHSLPVVNFKEMLTTWSVKVSEEPKSSTSSSHELLPDAQQLPERVTSDEYMERVTNKLNRVSVVLTKAGNNICDDVWEELSNWKKQKKEEYERELHMRLGEQETHLLEISMKKQEVLKEKAKTIWFIQEACKRRERARVGAAFFIWRNKLSQIKAMKKAEKVLMALADNHYKTTLKNRVIQAMRRPIKKSVIKQNQAATLEKAQKLYEAASDDSIQETHEAEEALEEAISKKSVAMMDNQAMRDAVQTSILRGLTHLSLDALCAMEDVGTMCPYPHGIIKDWSNHSFGQGSQESQRSSGNWTKPAGCQCPCTKGDCETRL